MKFDIDSFREIGDALLRNKSRSLLTGFGIFWGLFMLLFMMGGGQGLKVLLSKNFEGFATNTCIIVADATTKPYKGFKENRYWRMDVTDLERLRQMVPELDVVTPTFAVWGQTGVYDANSISCNIKGVYADYSKIETPKIKYGRYINEMDCIQERKVCVIGKRVYEALFPQGGDPCGKYIKVGSLYYQVVGVDVNNGNISIQGQAADAVAVPLPIVQKLFHRGDSFDLIAMTCKSGVKMSSLEDRIRQVIARKHQYDPTDKQALFVLNTEEMFQLMDNLFRGVNFLIWLVGLGTILAGAIGVSNIMMVTVKERTTEIGIRRAIGATPSEILSQIILESVSLTIAAGSFGIMLSVGLLRLLETIISMSPNGFIPFQISFTLAVVSMLLLAALGVIAGMAPATRAMSIKPVDAMRDE